MNKKFLSAILFGALMVTSTGTFVSCKDYDDDIDRIDKELSGINSTIASLDAAVKAGKNVQSYNAISGGYELIFTDGSKITILNGTNGIDGVTVVPQFRVNGDYWQYSTDEGATWVDVKDTNGNKVKAKGEDGASVSNVSWVNVEGTNYIKIGDKVTDLQQNNNIPNIAVDSTNKTVAVTVDGNPYILLQEGSAFNGLQTVVYRKQRVDDASDICCAYDIYNVDKNGNLTDEMFATVPAYASFKVYPGDFSLDNAKFSFVDTYKVRAAVEPALAVLEGSAYLDGENNEILHLAIVPNDGISARSYYATSLDVTMYDQYTSASDYFVVSRTKTTVKNIQNAFTTLPPDQTYPETLSADNTWNIYTSYSFGVFDYKGQYNLNDSIDAYVSAGNGVWLSETGISYSKEFRLLDENEEYDFRGTTIKTHQGLFEVKDGVLTVKADKQASAIDEYAAVEVKTTVKSQMEGVEDYVITDVVFLQAKRPAVNPVFSTVSLKPLKSDDDFAFTYSSTESQIVELDVRDFEAAIEGRDVIADNNSTYVTFINLFKPVYNADKKLIGYDPISSSSDTYYWNTRVYNSRPTAAEVAEGLADAGIRNEAVLYYINGGNNASNDHLYLILTPGAYQEEYKEMTLLAGSSTWYSWNSLGIYQLTDGVNTPYAVYNKYENKLFKVGVEKFSVTYEFDCPIKPEYESRTIIGEWIKNGDEYTSFTMQSQKFDEMYEVVPEDASVAFDLNEKNQNDYVKSMMKDGNIRWTSTNQIVFTPRVDLSKVGTLKVDIYDVTAGIDEDHRVLFATEEWTVKQPVKPFSGLVDLTYKNPAMEKGEVIKLADLIGTKWAGLSLTDAVGKKLVEYDKTALAVETANANLYKTAAESTGLKFVCSDTDFSLNTSTMELTWNAEPTGTVYEHVVNITIQFVHDWGVASTTFKVTVKRDI